jgi:hypothetical protein
MTDENGGPFGGLSPQDAARRSVEARRAKKADAEEPLDAEAILEKMARTAKSEHVRADAAKALIAIRAKRETQHGDLSEDAVTAVSHQLMEGMTPEERDTVAGILDNVILREKRPETPAGRAYLEQKMQRLWEEYSSLRSQLGLDPLSKQTNTH